MEAFFEVMEDFIIFVFDYLIETLNRLNCLFGPEAVFPIVITGFVLSLCLSLHMATKECSSKDVTKKEAFKYLLVVLLVHTPFFIPHLVPCTC